MNKAEETKVLRKTLSRAGLLAVLLLSASFPSVASETTTLTEGAWTKGGYEIEGSWSIVESDEGRFVVLADDFATRKAPDLKIFLSPRKLSELGNRNATSESAFVAALERNRGGQRYRLPAEVDLADYQTILIHCEKFSKYWGGAPLNTPPSTD